jgi:hypothetical protein
MFLTTLWEVVVDGVVVCSSVVRSLVRKVYFICKLVVVGFVTDMTEQDKHSNAYLPLVSLCPSHCSGRLV